MASDEMDSLFEGMVLFNPSQIEGELPQDNRQQDDCSDDSVQNHRKSDGDGDGDGDALTHSTPASSSFSSQLQPLDENLFSDLTLMNLDEVAEPNHDLQSQSRSQSQSQSQQPSTVSDADSAAAASTATISRRRKRSGLRIGYGRDSLFSNHLSHPPVVPLPPPNSETPTVPSHSSPIATDVDADDDAAVTVTHPSDDESSSLCDSSSRSEIIKDASREDDEAFSEAELRQMKARIHDKLNHARQLVISASAARKDSIRNRRKTVEKANLASLRHMELEKQLEEAIEAEDFERAEKVSENLSSSEKEKQTLSNSLREADAIIDALDFKLQQALDSQIAAEEECASLLDDYAMNASNNADLALKKATAVYAKEMDQWISSSEALEVKKMELEIESHLISEANLELNDTIEYSIEDDKREKEILCKRKDMLEGELQKLLALVEQKQKEIADNDSNLKAVDNNISNVVSGFKEIQSSIDDKYDSLQSVLAQVKLDTETLAVKKDEIESFLVQEEEKGAKLREFARISEEEAKEYREMVELRKDLMSSILKSREEKLTLADNEEKLSGDVKLFQQEVSAARASLQELSSRKSSIQQDIASFKERIIFIDKRVPELEAEKKVATAARNFKEAARIATEAKTLCVEKEGMQIHMDTAISNLKKLEEEIKGTLDKLQETEEMILLKEKELAMARYQRLLLTAATARAEKTAAQEMGDAEEANLLLAEAEAADSEAEKLQSTFNFKAEHTAYLRKHFISLNLVSYLDRKQLAELAASPNLFAG